MYPVPAAILVFSQLAVVCVTVPDGPVSVHRVETGFPVSASTTLTRTVPVDAGGATVTVHAVDVRVSLVTVTDFVPSVAYETLYDTPEPLAGVPPVDVQAYKPFPPCAVNDAVPPGWIVCPAGKHRGRTERVFESVSDGPAGIRQNAVYVVDFDGETVLLPLAPTPVASQLGSAGDDDKLQIRPSEFQLTVEFTP